jgi:hypothetical protein
VGMSRFWLGSAPSRGGAIERNGISGEDDRHANARPWPGQARGPPPPSSLCPSLPHREPGRPPGLHLPSGTPVGQHTRVGYGKDGQPVRVMVTVFAGDRHYLVYDQDETDS